MRTFLPTLALALAAQAAQASDVVIVNRTGLGGQAIVIQRQPSIGFLGTPYAGGCNATGAALGFNGYGSLSYSGPAYSGFGYNAFSTGSYSPFATVVVDPRPRVVFDRFGQVQVLIGTRSIDGHR